MTDLRKLAILRREATPGPWIRPWEANYLRHPGGHFDVASRPADLDFCAAAGSLSAEEWDALADVVDGIGTLLAQYAEDRSLTRDDVLRDLRNMADRLQETTR